MENMAIPKQLEAKTVVQQIKSSLQPFGNLEKFCAYGNIATNKFAVDKLTELHRLGVQLIHCPQQAGKTDAADRVMVVDAMNFLLRNSEGAAICLISGDNDFAYLLASLMDDPKWTTVVIARHAVRQSTLNENADANIVWEDLLGT